MQANFGLASAMIGIALSAVTARAGEITVDIGSLANEPWTYVGPNDFLIINGSTFPTGNQNFGGVPFAIPTGPNNYWAGAAAANFGPGTVSLTIPVGVSGVTSVFTLLNSMWGWAGPAAYLYVTFTGSDGATVTKPLVGNVNVRDSRWGGSQQKSAHCRPSVGQRQHRSSRRGWAETDFPSLPKSVRTTSPTCCATGHRWLGPTIGDCRRRAVPQRIAW